MSSEQQVKFLELAQYCEQLEEKLKQTREELAAKMTELGEGTYVQDPITSTVYKMVKPKGRFVYYRDIDYVRTAIGNERAGTLSKKEAESAGFTLKK